MRVPHYQPFPHRITIQNPPQLRTRAGGYTDDWTTVATNVKAMVIPTSSEEYVIEDRPQTVMLYSILVATEVTGIVEEQRIIWNTLELYVTGIIPEINQNGVQVIMASERKRA
jgi:head-tail adaptor